MAQTETKLEAPPYVAFKTFTNFLDWLQEAGVPSRIDRSFWGDRLSGAYGTQLMAALRFLRLIDEDNRPYHELEFMASDLEQRKSILKERLETYYAAGLGDLDLGRATQGELQERFRQYPVEGDTLRKAMVFFIHAAQYAGTTLSPHITRKTRGTRTNGAKPRKKKQQAPKPPRQGSEPESRQGSNVPFSLSWIGQYTLIKGLLERLPEPGKGSFDREDWFKLARAVFDAEYGKESNGS